MPQTSFDDRPIAAPVGSSGPSFASPAAARPGPEPVPWFANLVALLAGLGLGASGTLALSQESRATLSSLSGVLDATGRLSGVLGTYLMAVMLVLMARIPWLERTVGQDRLARWHRRIGGWPIALIALHVVTVIEGYALVTRTTPWSQFVTFVLHYPDMLAAVVGFALLLVVGVVSYPPVRRRLRYETWWAAHLFVYLALALAFAHQIKTGIVFLGHPLAVDLWVGGSALVLLTLLTSRLAMPIVVNVRHRLVLDRIEEVAPRVYALTVRGRRLDRLAVSGGQYFQWRFLAPGLLWHSHPYSLSALPRPPHMRVTVKALGDQTREIARLEPGTRVFVEGPYGAFTRHARTSRSVVLIGAGVGVTPLRAILDDLPADVAVTAILRASTPEDLVHEDEISALVNARGGVVHHLVGRRHEVSLDARTLRRLLPTIRTSDLYVCGPSGFTEGIRHAARQLRVPERRLHSEEFSF